MEDSLQRLKLQIEALLFAAEHAVDVSEIRSHLGEVSLAEVRLALRDLANDYESRAFSLFEFGGKYQLRTREDYAELVSKQFGSKPRSLSKSALETLAIVAYQQPVTRAQVSSVRGVDSSAIVQSLKDRDLIYVSGTRKDVGTPLEYRTTTKFLEVFGLSKLEDLPNLRSLQMSADDTKHVAKALAAANGEEEISPTSEELSFIEADVISSATEVSAAAVNPDDTTTINEVASVEVSVVSEQLECDDSVLVRAGAEAMDTCLASVDSFVEQEDALDRDEDESENEDEDDDDEEEDDDDDFIEIDDDDDEVKPKEPTV